MTEENNVIEPTETEKNENVDTQEKAVKVEEMQRRLSKEQEKYEKQIEELKANQDEAIQVAIKRAQEEAKLSGKELEEYKQREAERKHQAEIDERDAKINELLKAQNQREIKDEAINKLSELNIPVNENTLALVNADALEGMAEKAEQLAKIISTVKSDYAGSTPPNTSGGGATKPIKDMGSILDGAKTTPVS